MLDFYILVDDKPLPEYPEQADLNYAPTPTKTKLIDSHMRHLALILVILVLAGCSKDSEPTQRLPEFEYPFDSLDNGKIFVYKRQQTGEYSYVSHKRIKEAGVDYLVQETYNKKERVSGGKYRITNDASESVESYMYTYTDSLSGKFTKDQAEFYSRNIVDGKKYRGIYLELNVTTSNNIKAKMAFTETFKREDKITIGDRELDVIVFDARMNVKASHRYIPFLSSETVYTGENIYAKHLGLVKYWSESNDERFDWELVQIKNMD